MDLTVITQVMTKIQPILNRALPLAITGIVLTFIKTLYNK